VRGQANKTSTALRRSEPLRLEIPTSEQGFKLTRDNGLVLVSPAPGEKMRWSEWEKEQLNYRSIVLREDSGEVVSAGFAKFPNYGEAQNYSQELDQALAEDEEVYFTDKLDGSLIVRSVIDGQVFWRSRGALTANDYSQAAQKVAEAKYPALIDPNFFKEGSIQLEFVSPQFRVILPYQEDDLVLIGAARHSDLKQFKVPELEKLAKDNDLNIVELISLPHHPEQLIEAVQDWKEREGVVARCRDGQVFVKIKAADYLAKHRLKFALTARAIREVCLDREVKTLKDFEGYLNELGADWELVEDSKPLVETFISAYQAAESRLAELEKEAAQMSEAHPTRKQFAIEYATKLPGSETAAAFNLLDGDKKKAKETVLNMHLDRAFRDLEEKEIKLEASS
jgi:hypothetical protein